MIKSLEALKTWIKQEYWNRGEVAGWFDNQKAGLTTYLDTLYVALTGDQTVAGVKRFTSNVAIGDAGTPTAVLHIRKNVAGNASIRIENLHTAAASLVSIQAANGSGETTELGLTGTLYSAYGALQARNTYIYSVRDIVFMVDGGGGGSRGIVFATNGPNEDMRLDMSGNLGIGETAPAARLVIKGVNAKGSNTTENLIVLESNNNTQHFQLIAGLGLTTLVAAEYAYLQSVEQGVAFRPVILNPSGGNVGIGTTSPQGRLHAHDGTGGHIFVTKTGLINVAQTIIPDGTGDVTKMITGQFVIESGGASLANVFQIAPGGFVDATTGGFTLRLSVTAGGAFQAIRIGGAGTGTLAISATWL